MPAIALFGNAALATLILAAIPLATMMPLVLLIQISIYLYSGKWIALSLNEFGFSNAIGYPDTWRGLAEILIYIGNWPIYFGITAVIFLTLLTISFSFCLILIICSESVKWWREQDPYRIAEQSQPPESSQLNDTSQTTTKSSKLKPKGFLKLSEAEDIIRNRQP